MDALESAYVVARKFRIQIESGRRLRRDGSVVRLGWADSPEQVKYLPADAESGDPEDRTRSDAANPVVFARDKQEWIEDGPCHHGRAGIVIRPNLEQARQWKEMRPDDENDRGQDPVVEFQILQPVNRKEDQSPLETVDQSELAVYLLAG